MMTTYETIEAGIPTVADLLDVDQEESGEKLVDVPADGRVLLSFHNSGEMLDLIGPRMLVREKVLDKLNAVADILGDRNPDYRILLFYAYRALEVQRKYYSKALQTAKRQFSDASEADIMQFAHVLAACPDVAGHPTGGAVDVTLFDVKKNGFVDMGVEVRREAIHKAGKKIYPFSPEMSEDVLERRILLRDVMSSVGFAPFDGEFWHFSYGDREWAYNVGEKKASYMQVSLDSDLLDLD